MKTLNLKNKHLSVFSKVMTYDMTFVQSRLRRRFLALIAPALELREAARLEICEKYAIKDKDNKPTIINGKYKFPDNSEFPQHLDVLFQEDVAIDIPQSMKADIAGVRYMIETSTAVLNPDEQELTEEIITALTPQPKPKTDPGSTDGGVKEPVVVTPPAPGGATEEVEA